jgi:hypothetical protein
MFPVFVVDCGVGSGLAAFVGMATAAVGCGGVMGRVAALCNAYARRALIAAVGREGSSDGVVATG